MSIFNAAYATHYDQFYADKSYTHECDLVEAAVRQYAKISPTALLDIGCGTGGHAIEMARRGYSATGVDLSTHMLDLASMKSRDLPLESQPLWICGDARTFATNRIYDLAVMMFAVVGYLTSNEDVLAGLRNIRLHLHPDALFICDFWYGPAVLALRPSDRVRVLDTAEGKIIRSASTSLDVANHTADVTLSLWEFAHKKLVSETSETHRLRYFFAQEFALFLSQAGFAMEHICAFPTLDAPLTEKNWNALVVARAC